MLKKTVLFLVLPLFVFLVAGCATCRKQSNVEVQGIKNQISVLEAQIQTKDEEIADLNESVKRLLAEKGVPSGQDFSKRSVVSRVKSRPNAKQVQTALKNAGYNPGAIDGRIGKQTREAIRSFQKDNGLAVDGKVGKKTWELLANYLEQKVK